MRNKFVYVLVAIFIVSQPGYAWAQHDHSAHMDKSAIEVGNTICPVSGEEIGRMGDAIKHEYNGKIYNLCCPMCSVEFDKNPEKYSKIAEQQAKESMHEEKTDMRDMTEMEGMDKGYEHELKPVADEKGEISYYTCGMHPSVRVSVESYKNGETNCPICSMPLIPVKKNTSDVGEMDEDVISRVGIKARELKLAGIKTEPVKKRQLFKEIRAVGTVAYDPKLAVAQDEFISAVKSLEKAEQGDIQEIKDRAKTLVESSRRKLLLMGLSEDQIAQLIKTKTVQQNLVLPEDKMWIYGDVYEYELSWVKEGADVKVEPVSMSGQQFYGKILSINPVFDAQTRSVRFRALVDNPEHKLKPEMYVDVSIMSQYTEENGNKDVLSIPKSALLDTGRRTIVWVDKGNGDFEGRKVEIGPEAVDISQDKAYYPVIKGLKQDEKVVTKGNFLIDSQSQITGVASSAFGGSLSDNKNNSMTGSQAGHAH